MDQARKDTDKKLTQMERHISSIYKTAGKDIYKKWDAFMKSAEKKVEKLQTQYDEAKKSGDPAQIEETGKRLGILKRNVLLKDEYYKAMLAEVTTQLTNVNQTAAAYVNGELPTIYSINYNQMHADLVGYGFKFNMRSPETVKRLVTQGEVRLPAKKVAIEKDKEWNKKQINNAVLQGIIQGESIPQISQRIFPSIMAKTDLTGVSVDKMGKIIKQNRQAAVRNARTLVTGAENAGRQDSFVKAEEEGLVMTKVWIATGDSRTRDWHLSMDGQEVDVNEPFIDGNGNELMYPADPDAAPETVWNCRCSMKSDITGVRSKDGTIKPLSEYEEDNLHETEIEAERNRRAENKSQPVQASWTDKIKVIQDRVAKNGVTYDDLIEAGKLLADEMNPIYAGYKKKEEETLLMQKDAYAEYLSAQKQYANILAEKDENPAIRNTEDYKARLKDAETKEETAYNLYKKSIAEHKVWLDTSRISADDLSTKLGEVREVGSEGYDIKAHLGNTRSKNVKHIEWAYDHYPKSWVEKSVDFGDMSVGSNSRGCYTYWQSGRRTPEIKIASWNKDGNAIHELGHRFEHIMPEIREQEAAFYAKRTAGEELQWLGKGYAKDEKTRKDNFVNAYMGKDYGGDVFELVSMGMQLAYTAPNELADDANMQQWIFGLLTLIP